LGHSHGDRIRAAIKRVRNAIGATFGNERRRTDEVVNYRGTH
jgi:hypothetical protein